MLSSTAILEKQPKGFQALNITHVEVHKCLKRISSCKLDSVEECRNVHWCKITDHCTL